MKLKNFRRVAALGMAVGMTAVLAACGNTADTASSEAAESTAETADTAEEASAETADAEYAYLADFSFSDAFDENGYLKGVTAADYVTLPDDYADITISADLGQVSDDDINDYIDSNVLSNFATTNEVKDRAAADGDTVNIDYVGRIDGVAFDGGDTKGSGADLTLGSGTYIDNFEDQIVGHTPGETFDVTVTFPEDYGNEDLNGKEAVFETTLNYIKESVTPELTDDWVKENLGESMSLNSVDELKAFVKSTMLYDNQASDVYTALHDKASYADELPQTALDYYRDVLLYRIYTNAQKYGTDMNTLLSSGMMGSSYDSVDAYLADANDSIKSITQQALLMQAVAEKTGFKCDTATMNADFGRYYGTTDPSQYVSAYGENYIKMNVLQSDVMQNLIDNVTYTYAVSAAALPVLHRECFFVAFCGGNLYNKGILNKESFPMPLIIPKDLPAYEELQQENVFVMHQERAMSQHIRPLRILILNLMPTKIVTETQLARLLANSPLQVQVTFLQTATHSTTHTAPEHMKAFYKTFDEIKNERFDGMIITGAPIEDLDYEDVDYWDELCRIMDYTKENVYSTIHLCWGALAGLYYHFGIPKVHLDKKMFGVFEHRVTRPSNPLVRGFDEVFYAPHSRWAGLDRAAIDACGDLRILAESDIAGPMLLSTESGRQIFVIGHPEYDKYTLDREYKRDVKAGKPINIPCNYYPDDNPSRDPLFRWRAHGYLLYTNWLNYYVYQDTPYDLSRLEALEK